MPHSPRQIARLIAENEALVKTVAELRQLAGTKLLAEDSLSPKEIEKRIYSERLDEYKFLRTEIEAIWNQTYTTLNFILVGMAGMISLAFSSSNRLSILLLPMASCLGLGGYRLIRIHTTRVWRIVGYMRCALEKNLYGIRWETRLFHRHEFLASKAPSARVRTRISSLLPGGAWIADHRMDRDIFDGHIQILDLVNLVLAALILAVNFSGHGDWMTTAVGWAPWWHQHWKWSLGLFFQLILPLGSLGWSRLTQVTFRRGEGEEEKHIRSWWDHDGARVRAAEAEPPSDFPARAFSRHRIKRSAEIFPRKGGDGEPDGSTKNSVNP